MATRLPIVVATGQLEQRQAGDSIDCGVAVGSYAPGSFTLADGQYARMVKELRLVGADRATLAGDSRLVIED